MTSVKTGREQFPPLPDWFEPHLAVLVGRLHQQMRSALRENMSGLRASQLRVLDCLPPDGLTIAEIAEVVSMTSQAVGQFVTVLADGGHVRVRTDTTDRRRRIVLRTKSGDRAVNRLRSRLEQLEQAWSNDVGTHQYQQFRDVLQRLTLGS